MRAFFRSPLLHFLVLGIGLYLFRYAGPAAETEVQTDDFRIEIARATLDELTLRFNEQMGRPPSQAEIDRMVDAEVDEEILFREAMSRGLLERDGGVQTRLIQKMLFLEGEAQIEDAPDLLARAVELNLHQDDIVVRRILVQKMKLLGAKLSAEQQVTDPEIKAAYQEQADILRSPPRVDLQHVFASRDRRGEATTEDALALLARLQGDAATIDAAPSLGDPFPLGHRLAGRSQRDLERTFGGVFGEAVFAAESDRWFGPIESAYGQHLVFVIRREPGTVPPLSVVADRLRLQLEEDRRDRNLDTLMNELRPRYVVVAQESG